MPKVNYCKSCHCEAPLVEICPYCGKKLTKTNVRIVFESTNRPVSDWFCWSAYLRILLPVWAVVLVLPIVLEFAQKGVNGVARLFQDGFLILALGLLIFFLLLILILLILQGEEIISYIIDKDGLQERCFLYHPKKINITSRFVSDETVWNLSESEEQQPLEGMILVRRTIIPWEKIRKVNCWKMGSIFLVYRPKFWRILTIHCPEGEYQEAEEYIRSKLKSKPKAVVLPESKTAQKGKR